jgi:hypothetical protein
VVTAAEAVLKREGSVGPVELLVAMGFLPDSHVRLWRHGHEEFDTLEPHIQCGAEKLSRTWHHFQEWIQERGLRPVEARYVRSRPGGETPLQITRDGDPQREEFFRTHYAPAETSAGKSRQIEKKLAKAPDIVVYELASQSSKCDQCGAELWKGEFLYVEQGKAHCMTCADLDHLEFLPAGDTALTRRTRKHSQLSAVVVRFSRARKRYERQGILATPEAIAQAEDECESDAAERSVRRAQEAARRRGEDRELIEEMARVLGEMYPGCPAAELRRIAEHTALRGSGRVGRSAAGRALDSGALELAAIAWIRHNHTNYDTLLMRGVDRQTAREMVRDARDDVLRQWSSPSAE